jgi:hypothetical protein
MSGFLRTSKSITAGYAVFRTNIRRMDSKRHSGGIQPSTASVAGFKVEWPYLFVTPRASLRPQRSLGCVATNGRNRKVTGRSPEIGPCDRLAFQATAGPDPNATASFLQSRRSANLAFLKRNSPKLPLATSHNRPSTAMQPCYEAAIQTAAPLQRS